MKPTIEDLTRWAEADRLAAQDPGQAGAVAIGVEASRAATLGADQLLVFVETKRAGSDAERLAHLPDGVITPLRVHAGAMIDVYVNVNCRDDFNRGSGRGRQSTK